MSFLFFFSFSLSICPESFRFTPKQKVPTQRLSSIVVWSSKQHRPPTNAMSVLRKLLHRTLNSFPSSTLTSSNLKPLPHKLTNAQYDNLINTAGQRRDFDALHLLLNHRAANAHSNTTKTFRFITHTDDSLSILDDLTDTLSRLRAGYTRKNAFDFLIVRLCEIDRVDESLRVAYTMALRCYGFDAHSFRLMLESLISNDALEEAWRVVDAMKELGVSLDVSVYNLFISRYCATGDLATAARVLAEMEEEGVKGDAHTYDALVMGACGVGNVEEAMVLLRRMVDDGVGVLGSTHVYVVDALVKMRCWEQAVEYVRSYCGKKKGLDDQIFNRLAKALFRSCRFKEARMVLEEIERRGIAMPYYLQKKKEKIVGKVTLSSLF